MTKQKWTLTALAFALTCVTSTADAGVFNVSHFTSTGAFGVGIEPELNFGDSSDAGFNLRGTYGVNDLSNVNAFLGTGGNQRQFRMGGNYTFDFFPDVGNQPGIGIAAQGLFVQRSGVGTFELTAIPYLHKTFTTSDRIFEPFVAVPIGLSLAMGRYHVISSLALGSLFHHNQHISSVVEVGIKLNNTDTYISGGFIYYN